MRRAAAIVLMLALAGCGARAELKPKPGHVMPDAPYGRSDKPGANDLLASAPQSRPGRNVERHARSEERTDDPFDLPPP